LIVCQWSSWFNPVRQSLQLGQCLGEDVIGNHDPL